MGYPPIQQPQQPPFAIPAPQQPTPTLGPQPTAPPSFNPYLQPQAAPTAPDAPAWAQGLLASIADQRNQIAQLTGAVNGLGQNQTALHDWLVGAANNLQGMVGSIAQSIKNEGALGFLKQLFSGPGTP